VQSSREAVMRRWGWLIHFYTGCGTVAALVALDYIEHERFRAAFLVMAAALFIDATDGSLARAIAIRRHVPEFDGAMLDNITDYLNYVLVPVMLMRRARILPAGTPGMLIAAFVMLASGYGFCRVDAKTPDHYFRGFPSYWNILALYLFLIPLPPRCSAIIVTVLAVLVFAPIKFIYPSRTLPMRRTTLIFAAIWSVTTFMLVLRMPQREPLLLGLSLAFVVYYFLASWALQWLAPPIDPGLVYDESPG